ncbi:MAG: hypothetical protein AAF572_20090 [Cyanobacteria bacterium P01_B01_bin.77]
MNHRFALRLVTNLTVWLLTLSCVGIVLWVIDEFLGWDILPDALSLLVRALLVAGGIIALVLVVMNVVLSLALVAEANASRARLPDYSISRRFTLRVGRTIVGGVLAIALLLGGLQVINQLRLQAATRADRAEFAQMQDDLDVAMEQVVGLFPPPLLEALESNTLEQQGQLGNLKKLLQSVSSSFPHNPAVAILIPSTEPPFKYARIEQETIVADNKNALKLSPKLYLDFPTQIEAQVVEQLMAGQHPQLEGEINGDFIRTDIPSSWGILKQRNQAIAVVYLESTQPGDFYQQSFHHDGPAQLISN